MPTIRPINFRITFKDLLQIVIATKKGFWNDILYNCTNESYDLQLDNISLERTW